MDRGLTEICRTRRQILFRMGEAERVGGHFFSFNFAEAKEDRHWVNHGRVEREKDGEAKSADLLRLARVQLRS